MPARMGDGGFGEGRDSVEGNLSETVLEWWNGGGGRGTSLSVVGKGAGS